MIVMIHITFIDIGKVLLKIFLGTGKFGEIFRREI
jgi:hypothetical protein